MTKLLTSTAIGLIAAFAVQAQAQNSNSQTAQMEDPCTAQWVAVDENNDGTISKSEAQKAMDVQFSEIDADGDNMVSVKEWKDCTVPSAIPGGFQSAEGTGTERTPPGALTEGETAGTADSGQQDTSEQAQATDAGQQGTSEQAQAAGDDSQQDTSEQAQAAGDDSPQETESTRALQATPEVSGVAEPRSPADWSEEMFADVDTDLSGYITAEEAGEWTRNRVTGTMDDEETIGRYGAMFSMIDEDGDGRITQEEWQARDEMDVEGRFGRADKDGDGQLSQTEWRDYRQQRFEQAQQDTQQQGQDTQQQAQQDTQQQGQDQEQADAGQEPTIWLYYFRSL